MDDFYRDLGETYRKAVRAFADAGCRYLQLDEVNLAYLCDPTLRKQITDRGEDPAALPDIYAGMINAAISDIPPDMTITMHLCRGNFRSSFVASRRLRAGGRSCCSTASTCTAISWNTTASAPAASSRCASCPRARPSCSVSSPANPAAGKPRRDQAPHRAGGEIHRHRSALPVAAMRLRLDRGRQRACRGRAMGEAADDRRNRRRSVGLRKNKIMQRTKPPFRADHVGSLLRPAALKAGARAPRQGRDHGRRAESGGRPRDRGRHQEAGSGRPAIDHRRRIPPLVVASRFPLGPRRRREDTSWIPASRLPR